MEFDFLFAVYVMADALAHLVLAYWFFGFLVVVLICCTEDFIFEVTYLDMYGFMLCWWLPEMFLYVRHERQRRIDEVTAKLRQHVERV